MRVIFIAMLSAALMLGCTKEPPANPDEAERAVPLFHTGLNDRLLDQIYEGAAPELRARQSKEEFVRYLDAVREKMGLIERTNRIDTKVDGSRVTLTYKSQYAKGEATEEFVIRKSPDKDPQLLSYKLLSPAVN